MRASDIFKLLTLAALWGASFLFMRVAVPVLGPIWLIELRVLLAGLALLPFLSRLNVWPQVRGKIVPLFILGCVNSALPFLCFAFATLFLPAGFTSILNATSPLFGTLIAVVWLNEKMTFGRIGGFILGFVGVVMLVGWEAVGASSSFFIAVGAGLSAALMYAIAAPYIKRQLSDLPPLAIATVSLLSAATILLPALPFTMPGQPPTHNILLSVLALALLSTALAYLLYFRLIQNVGATRALTVTYLIPLFAMLWGAIILDEIITRPMLIGCGLILLGVAIANDLFGDKRAS